MKKADCQCEHVCGDDPQIYYKNVMPCIKHNENIKKLSKNVKPSFLQRIIKLFQ